MINRTVSLPLSLALLVNGVQPIHAVDLVAIPQNVHLPTPHSSIQTRSSELSFKSIETKINNVLKPEKTQPKVAATDDSGSCGSNITYNFTADNGKLTISGSSAMWNYSNESGVPWYSYRSSIQTVVIENGVTSIGSYAFFGCSGLTSVTYKGTSDPGSSDVFSGRNNLYRVLVPSDYKSNTFCGIPVTKRTSSFTSTFKPSLFKFGFMLL